MSWFTGLSQQWAQRRLTAGLVLGLAVAGLSSWVVAPPAHALASHQVTLTVNQTFTKTGLAAPPITLFEYRLTPKTPSGAPMPAGGGPGGYSFTIDGTGQALIGPIDFPDPGVYVYELTHVTPVRSGYTYSQAVYTIKVYVDSDPDVPLGVVAYKLDQTKAMDLAFGHSFDSGNYQVEESDPATMPDPPVVVTVKGKPDPSDDTFVFQLVPESSSNPMPPGSDNGVKTVRIKGQGQAQFGSWSYTKPGTYVYRASQVNTGLPGYTFDSTVYTIIDTVTDVNGALVVKRQIFDQFGRSATALVFTDIYATSHLDIPPAGDRDAGSSQAAGQVNNHLPFTGSNAAAAALGALTALLAGWLLLLAKRRRQRHYQAAS